MSKIVFNASDVRPAVESACASSSSKNLIPILSDVIVKYFMCADDVARMAVNSSDGEQWLSCTADILDGDDGFVAAVNAKDFLGAIKSLTGMEVTMELNEDRSEVRLSYDSGSIVIPCNNPEEFPRPQAAGECGNSVSVPADVMLDAISFTRKCASPDILRPIMNGIHFDFFEERMVAVALDKSKMAKYTNSSVHGDGSGFTMPAAAAQVLYSAMSKFGGDVTLKFGDSMMQVSGDRYVLVARLCEGKYPPYDRLLAAEPTRMAVIGRCDVISSIDRMFSTGGSDGGGIVLAFSEGNLGISMSNAIHGKSSSDDIQCVYEGEPLRIGVNGRSLSSVLSSLESETVKLKMSGEEKPIIIEPYYDADNVSLVSLIMPMRI